MTPQSKPDHSNSAVLCDYCDCPAAYAVCVERACERHASADLREIAAMEIRRASRGVSVDSKDHEIGAATRQRPAPRHQEQESMMQEQPTSPITLRRAMQSREGDADDQIRRGRYAWAVERRDVTYTGDLGRPQTAIVFGTCRSDALRRAQYGARLGESHHGTDWRLAEITSGWDEPFVWPNSLALDETLHSSEEGT